ncbi:MAG: hypothetical protein C0602_08325 [Denitrovibrio sp.]|nr:MAG: hypothetical protein C0602_08325 [Denitrovibrio sp.]
MFVISLRKAFSVLLLALFVFHFNIKVYSETLSLQPRTLSDVMADVAATNPEILEAIQVYEGVVHEVAAAESGYKPKVVTDLSIGKQVTDGVASNEVRRDLTASSASLYVRQNLFNGNGTDNHVNETKARVKAAAYEVLNVANKVFEGVVESYINILKELALLQLSENNIYTQAQILEQIKEKTEAGFGRASDLLNAQSKLALARANFISQQQNLKQASVKFHKYYGKFLDPKQLVEPTDLFPFPDREDEVVDMAFKSYPAIQVSKYNVIARKYTMKRTESLYFPKIDAELKANYSNNTSGDVGDTTSYSAMLYFNYELYDGGLKKAEKQKNYSQVLKEHERSYIERRNLNESVRLAWNIKEAEDRKYEFLQEHIDLTEKTLDAFKQEYELGRRTLLELLDMENEYQRALEALTESKYTSMIAHYRVMFVTGVLLQKYKMDIFDKVGLSDEEVDFATLEKYRELGTDRDMDKVNDNYDKCDNSILNSKAGTYGCFEKSNIKVGYTRPDKIEPYIKPKGAQTLESSEGLGEPLSLGEPEGLGEPLSLGEPESLGEPLVAEEAPEPQVMEIENTKEAQSFNFDNVTFLLNSSRLTKSSEKIVKKVAAQLKTIDNFSLEIIGHTDTSGRASFNRELSAERADTVLKKLAKMGVDPAKMKAYGKGENEPLYSNATREGRKKNRRIEFRLQLINYQK